MICDKIFLSIWSLFCLQIMHWNALASADIRVWSIFEFQVSRDVYNDTAIPYRTSTRPEQGFPCVLFLTWKNLFSLKGNPVLIAGTLFSLQGFPCEKSTQGKPYFHDREWVCSGYNVQLKYSETIFWRSKTFSKSQ